MTMHDIYGMAAKRHNNSTTPQTQQADEAQVRNHQGGYSFTVDDLARVKRFLVMGSDAGSYYQTDRELTIENMEFLKKMADSTDDALAVGLVYLIRDVSVRGLAPKVRPALFALAIAANGKNKAGRAAVKDVFPEVVRTGSHLLTYTQYVDLLGGWSRGKRAAVNRFYEQDADTLAYQLIKYRNRDGWTQRDVLRVAHTELNGQLDKGALFEWVTKGMDGEVDTEVLPELVWDFEVVQGLQVGDVQSVLNLIEGGSPLSWEMLPDWALTYKEVWVALLDHNRVPMTALIRNLGRLTKLGVINGVFSEGRTFQIVERLTDAIAIKKSRIHPLSILIAAMTYKKGEMRSGGSYSPSANILDALDTAFYLAFENVAPAGKRTLVALDISASMDKHTDPSGNLTARQVGTAMALVIKVSEPWSEVYGFSAVNYRRDFMGNQTSLGENAFVPLNIGAKERLDAVTERISALPMGGTDCSLPMREALNNKWEVDTFVIITDNESSAGPEHAHQALERYRKSKPSRKDAKMIVVSVTATNLSVADPKDLIGQLDICGFGSDVPQLVSAFSAGI